MQLPPLCPAASRQWTEMQVVKRCRGCSWFCLASILDTYCGHGDTPLANCPFPCDFHPEVPKGFSKSPQSSCFRVVRATVGKHLSGRAPPKSAPLTQPPHSPSAPACAGHQHQPRCCQPPWGPLAPQLSWKPKTGIPDLADLSPNNCD